MTTATSEKSPLIHHDLQQQQQEQQQRLTHSATTNRCYSDPEQQKLQHQSTAVDASPTPPNNASFQQSDIESANQPFHASRPRRPHVSLFWIYVLSIANLGIGASWALEFAVVTPYFEKTLMSGTLLSHGVWVAGPVSGLIVAPIIGSVSDRCTSRYGRRRPFIVGGLLATVIGMLVFSNAREITYLFFTPGTEAFRIAALVIAVCSFCVLDLAINTTMWPIRALQGDLVPEHQQQLMQSATVAMNSVGDLAVNALVQTFAEPISQIRPIFVCASIFYTLTICSLLYYGRETPLSNDNPAVKNAEPTTFNVLNYLRSLPNWMWRIGLTNALGFFTFYCRQPNASEWISSSVLGGDPNAPRGSPKALAYERGVNLYGRAGIIRGPLQILFSAFYPRLLNSGVTPGALMGASFLFYALYLIAFSTTHTPWIAVVGIIVWALPQATLLSVPMGMTVELSDEFSRGRYLGALNIFAVIPQLIDTAYTGIISKAFGEWMIMYITAFWGLLTAVFAFFFITSD